MFRLKKHLFRIQCLSTYFMNIFFIVSAHNFHFQIINCMTNFLKCCVIEIVVAIFCMVKCSGLSGRWLAVLIGWVPQLFKICVWQVLCFTVLVCSQSVSNLPSFYYIFKLPQNKSFLQIQWIDHPNCKISNFLKVPKKQFKTIHKGRYYARVTLQNSID